MIQKAAKCQKLLRKQW